MTKLLSVALVAAAVVAIPAAQALADCGNDMKQVKVKLAREQDLDRRIAVRKLLTKAEAHRPTSETECRNYVVRAWRLLREEPATTKPQPVETDQGTTPRGIPAPDTSIARPNTTIPQVTTRLPQPAD